MTPPLRRRLDNNILALIGLALVSLPGQAESQGRPGEAYTLDLRQIPSWSQEDLAFFLNGTMGTEVIPERALGAFQAAYGDLFPGGDLSAFGVLEGADGELPLGFSRRRVPHLGDQMALGINCAACHVGDVTAPDGSGRRRVLGRPSLFDPFSFFGAVTVAMLRTATPEGMAVFLRHYLKDSPAPHLEAELRRQAAAIAEVVAEDPFASKTIPPDGLHTLSAEELEYDGKDLLPLVRGLLKQFHNVRAALHLPEQPPPLPKALPGPGRNDAFGLLSAAFFGVVPEDEAPSKFGPMWNLAERRWVHWDGNNDSPMARNLAAVLGLGTPMDGEGAMVDFASLERQTALTEAIRSPRFPWPVDGERAAQGEETYRAHCSACHGVRQERQRLVPVSVVETDPNRARVVNDKTSELLNAWVRSRRVEGYAPPKRSWRSTGEYWAADLRGVWARSPFLHNGSVRTLRELLTPPASRAATFQIGSAVYDREAVGFADSGSFTFDASIPGNSNRGHDFGTDLTSEAKAELIEYLKTL